MFPDIVKKIAKTVKQMRTADTVTLITNGILIPKVPIDTFDDIDIIKVSVHKDDLDVEKIVKLVRNKCDLIVEYFDDFRESYSEFGTNDAKLTQDIYDTCLEAHYWDCFNLENGIFYKCPQAHSFKPFFEGLELDGVRVLDNPNLFNDLVAYLSSEKPLSACKYCLGTSGKIFKSVLIPRCEWRNPQKFPTEDLVDYDFMNAQKKKKVLDDSGFGCTTDEVLYKKQTLATRIIKIIKQILID